MLIEYNSVSGETISGSANRSSLGVIKSGPAVLLGFRALIFLDINSLEIEKEEIVRIGVSSLPTSTCVTWKRARCAGDANICIYFSFACPGDERKPVNWLYFSFAWKIIPVRNVKRKIELNFLFL